MSEPVILTHDRLLQLAGPFGDLMNKMQFDGENLSEVITAGLYAMGVALAHMRVDIQFDDSVSTGLLPLWTGYSDYLNIPVTVIPRTVQ